MTTIENRPTTGDGGPDPVFPRRRRRWPRAVAIVLVLLAVGASALTWRLLDGPIWTDLLAGTVAARVAAELGPDAKVDVGVVGLSLDQGYRPEFHLRDVVISQPGKGSVSIDSLSVSRAWSGSARRAERVVADHVLLDITGGIRPLPAAAEVLAALDAALARPPVGFVEIGSLTIGRRVGTSQRTVAVERAAVTMEVADDGAIRMSLAGAGAEGPWSIRALGSAADGDGARTVDVRGTGLDVADLVAMAEEGPPLASGPIGFEGTITLTDGVVTDGRGQLTVGPLRAPDDTALPLVGSRSRLEVAMRAGGRTVVVLPSPIVLPGGQAILSGEIDVPQDGETAWPFDLNISLRGTAAADERRGAGQISGRYDPAEGLFVVDRFQASGEGTTFTAAMRVTHSDGRVAGALSGVFASMSVDALKAIWPSFVVADGRRWVMEHVESGMIRDATVDLTFSDRSIDEAAAAATATVNFRVEDLAFKVLDDGPMIRGATGSGRLQDGRFEVTLDGGDVDLGADGTLAIPSGRFVIPDISERPPRGEVALSLSGNARASLAMWGRLPMARAAPLPVAPADASGSMAANISLSLPLVRGVKADEVSYEARLRLAELAFATPVEGRRLSDGSLQITVADGVATVAGDALLDGVRAEIDLSESLTGDGRSASAVRLRLSGKDRERLGIGLKDVLIGPVGVSIDTVEAADGVEVQTVEVDLAETRLRIRPLGIDKKKGVPGTARFTMKKTGSQILVDDLRLEADGAVIVGDLRLDADGRLLSATLPRIAARAGDKLSLTAKRAGDGVLDVEVRGDRFDARRLVRSQLRGAGPTEAGDALRVDVTIGAVTGFGDEALTGFNLAAALSGGTVTSMALTTQTAGSGSASMTLTPAGAVRRLEMEAGEVGRLLRFLGIYRRVYGGRAVVTGIVDAAGGITASIDGSRLRIVNEPALGRLATAAEKGAAAKVETVDIERLLFDLRFADGRLSIDDGVVRAATAGLSIQGDIDFSRETMRLSGTYLPASAFDSLLGKIPLIGQTLFAGGRAGLLGVTFRLSGSIEEPLLSVNPLSAIAPGIFRKLFELR